MNSRFMDTSLLDDTE
jgi:hypothetical protein